MAKKNLRILTNVRHYQLAGIAQTLNSFIDFTRKTKSDIKFIGVEADVCERNSRFIRKDEKDYVLNKFSLPLPKLTDTVKISNSIEDLKRAYEPLVDGYRKVIASERPDLILINGTYYLPWCLLAAAKDFDLPIVHHYHGSMTKEAENWDDRSKNIFNQMEKDFDSNKIYYIFPSTLAKKLVEKEIFNHKIKRSSVIPNAIPLHFFEMKKIKKEKTIGFVGRWSYIKNREFIKSLAKFNGKQGEFGFRAITDITQGSKDQVELEHLVKFKKPTDSGRLARFYQSISVLINPSFFETYGNVAQEAVASGTPALVSRNMGVAETFTQLGLKDLIIEYEDEKMVYQRIKETHKMEISEKIRKEIKSLLRPRVVYGRLIEGLKQSI